MLADAFVILASLVLVAVALTQVLIPLIQNKPLFVSLRKSYQREKWLKQQLEETNRRIAELELEKQLADNRNELLRRQMEEIDSHWNFTSSSADQDTGMKPHTDISNKER